MLYRNADEFGAIDRFLYALAGLGLLDHDEYMSFQYEL
jgi:hypothetical protein